MWKRKLLVTLLAAGLLITGLEPRGVLASEFSDGMFLEESTEEFSDSEFEESSSSPESLFSEGAEENVEGDSAEFVSEEAEVSEFGSEMPDITELLSESNASEENSIRLYCNYNELGCYSTLDEAMEQMTDPEGTYVLKLSKGVYEQSCDFPAAESIRMEYPSSIYGDTEMMECTVQITVPEVKLNSSLYLENVSLYFESPQSRLFLGSNGISFQGMSLAAARLEAPTDMLSIVGEQGSWITLNSLSGEGGFFQTELNIDTMNVWSGDCTVLSSNACHTIQTLNVNANGSLFFMDGGNQGSSVNTVSIENMNSAIPYRLLFSERFDCLLGSCDFGESGFLSIYEVAGNSLPQWGTVTFSDFLPSAEQVNLFYTIQSEQDSFDMDHMFFTQGQPVLRCAKSPNRTDLSVSCFLVNNEQILNSQEYILEDNDDGNYYPNTSFGFYYDQVKVTNADIPVLGKKLGNVSVSLDGNLDDYMQIKEAYWMSPDEKTVFEQGKTYLLYVKLENQPQCKGKFTGKETCSLVLGGKTITGTAEVTSDNKLIVKYPYTINRIASLSKVRLKSAKCVNGTTAAVSWDKVSKATGYRIYRKTAKTSWKGLKNVSASGTLSYKDTTAKPGTTYYYTVRAYRKNPDGSTTWSSYDKKGLAVKTVILAPKLVSTRITAKGIQVKWKKSQGATGYRIYRRTGSSKWKRVGAVNGTTTVFYDNTVTGQGTYYYNVKGTYGKVLGKAHKTGLKITVPKLTAPKLISTKWEWYSADLFKRELGVEITWKPVKGAQYYYIMRRKAGSSKWTLLKKQAANLETEYLDGTANFNTNYYYTVRPVIAKYYGPYSSYGIYREKYFNITL